MIAVISPSLESPILECSFGGIRIELINRTGEQTIHRTRQPTRWLEASVRLLETTAALLIIAIGWFGYLTVVRTTKTQVSETLQAAVRTKTSAVRGWVAARKSLVEGLAGTPRTRELVKQLVELAQRPGITPDDLRKSAALAALRSELGPVVRASNNVGFVVTDRSGVNVGALLDQPIGLRTLGPRTDIVPRVLNGEVVLSHPFRAGISLPDLNGVFHDDASTMLVAAPVRDEKGEIIAALSFRLRPEADFTRMLTAQLGQTYAFDRDGTLLSDPDLERLHRAGLIESLAPGSAINRVRLVEPGGNLLQGFHPNGNQALPFTRMARSATQELAGVDVESYPDLCGIPVVGAWTWLPELQLGIATELPAPDAYRLVNTLRTTFSLLFWVASFAGVGLVFLGRRRAQLHRALKVAAHDWSDTFNAIEMPLLVVDDELTVRRLNTAAAQLAQRPSSECVGQPLTKLEPQTLWSRAADLCGADPDHAPSAGQFTCAVTGKTWELAVTSFDDSKGGGRRFIVMARDVTRMLELQQSLREQEKLSAMGTLVAAVAHEVRNPLFAASATLDAFETKLGDREETRPYLSILRAELNRLSSLMHDLLEYGKTPRELVAGSPVPALQQAVQSSLLLAQRSHVALEVEVELEVDGQVPQVQLDSERLSQVFQNVIQNAIQHAPAGSAVHVSFLAARREGRSVLECVVEDSGPGFKAADLPRVFEPFFSRRAKGTGLGLSIVQRIVKEHSGAVAVGNRPQGGATVSITLPTLQGGAS
jgi:signal transduction histidine kinase